MKLYIMHVVKLQMIFYGKILWYLNCFDKSIVNQLMNMDTIINVMFCLVAAPKAGWSTAYKLRFLARSKKGFVRVK